MIKCAINLILFISVMGCTDQNVQDLSQINFGESAAPLLKTLTVANSYATDTEKKIWNYFIAAEKSPVSYGNILFDEGVEVGVVNNRIAGYKGVVSANATDRSDELLKRLVEDFGNGKLIRTDGKLNHVYIWQKDGVIIHYLVGITTLDKGDGETVSGALTVVDREALEQGLWPYSKGLLAASDLPDLR